MVGSGWWRRREVVRRRRGCAISGEHTGASDWTSGVGSCDGAEWAEEGDGRREVGGATWGCSEDLRVAARTGGLQAATSGGRRGQSECVQRSAAERAGAELGWCCRR